MPNFKEINQYLVPQSSKNFKKLSIPKFTIITTSVLIKDSERACRLRPWPSDSALSHLSTLPWAVPSRPRSVCTTQCTVCYRAQTDPLEKQPVFAHGTLTGHATLNMCAADIKSHIKLRIWRQNASALRYYGCSGTCFTVISRMSYTTARCHVSNL